MMVKTGLEKCIFEIPPSGSHFLLIHFTWRPFLQNHKFSNKNEIFMVNVHEAVLHPPGFWRQGLKYPSNRGRSIVQGQMASAFLGFLKAGRSLYLPSS